MTQHATRIINAVLSDPARGGNPRGYRGRLATVVPAASEGGGVELREVRCQSTDGDGRSDGRSDGSRTTPNTDTVEAATSYV